MTPLEFYPYHNYHIRFKLINGTELSGVIWDPANQHITNKPATVHDFITTNKMVEWKQAEAAGNQTKMKNLQGEIDISEIVWAERI